MATDWPEEQTRYEKILDEIFFFMPKSNPGYDEKMHLVKSWLIEFLEEKSGELLPWREIALDKNEKPIFAGPDKTNYGFWHDTNMKYHDFKGESIEKGLFEKFWLMSGAKELE